MAVEDLTMKNIVSELGEAYLKPWTGKPGDKDPREGGGLFSNFAQDRGLSSYDYAKVFGYSPIPVIDYDEGPRKFAPGLRKTYEQLCAGSAAVPWEASDPNTLFKVEPAGIGGSDLSSKYIFDVPANEILKGSGFDPAAILENLSKVGGEALENPLGGAGMPTNFSNIIDEVKQSLTILGDSKLEVAYKVPGVAQGALIPSQKLYQDSYSLDVNVVPGVKSSTVADVLNNINTPKSC